MVRGHAQGRWWSCLWGLSRVAFNARWAGQGQFPRFVPSPPARPAPAPTCAAPEPRPSAMSGVEIFWTNTTGAMATSPATRDRAYSGCVASSIMASVTPCVEGLSVCLCARCARVCVGGGRARDSQLETPCTDADAEAYMHVLPPVLLRRPAGGGGGKGVYNRGPPPPGLPQVPKC